MTAIIVLLALAGLAVFGYTCAKGASIDAYNRGYRDGYEKGFKNAKYNCDA